jgi:predicted nucleic acid-binding protein
MSVEVVLDASMAAKCYFLEPGQARAVALVLSGVTILAPDLIFSEVANVAAKKFRRGQVSMDLAQDAVADVGKLISEVISASSLAVAAFDLAASHGFSAYDGIYLALADARGAVLATADERLIARADKVGLGHLIWTG